MACLGEYQHLLLMIAPRTYKLNQISVFPNCQKGRVKFPVARSSMYLIYVKLKCNHFVIIVGDHVKLWALNDISFFLITTLSI